MANPQVILSGFADEATRVHQKTAVEQFAAFAALGLQYYTIRFIDAGKGVKQLMMQLTKSEVNHVRKLQDEYGLNVSSLGSPIGKVKLLDVDDKTSNRYVPFDTYLKKEVVKACELAHAFETKLIRGFSFYHPRGEDPRDHLPQVVDQLVIAETCHKSDLLFGLEVEANLVGQNGELLAELHRKVSHPAMVLIFDAGNIVTQGYSSDAVFTEYLKMKRGMGWMHIKDYRHPEPMQRLGHIDEEALKHFVPADIGDSGHEAILCDFREDIPRLERKLKRLGVPGVFLDLEPHVKGGGQFGGFSGPDGLGVALRGLCKLLDYVGIDYHLRDFDDILASRGL